MSRAKQGPDTEPGAPSRACTLPFTRLVCEAPSLLGLQPFPPSSKFSAGLGLTRGSAPPFWGPPPPTSSSCSSGAGSSPAGPAQRGSFPSSAAFQAEWPTSVPAFSSKRQGWNFSLCQADGETEAPHGLLGGRVDGYRPPFILAPFLKSPPYSPRFKPLWCGLTEPHIPAPFSVCVQAPRWPGAAVRGRIHVFLPSWG